MINSIQEQKQSLSHNLSPYLLQSADILQANSIQLEKILQQALATNPILEEVSPLEEKNTSLPQSSTSISPQFPTQLPIAQDETLADFLANQISASNAKKEIRETAKILANNLSDNGFLRNDLKELAKDGKISLSNLKEAKNLLNRLEPAGIGASNLKECLLIQLSRLPKNPIQEKAMNLVANHSSLLAEKKYKEIEKLNLIGNKTQIKKVIDLLSSLNPKPGEKFSQQKPLIVSADIMLIPNSKGEFEIELVRENLPQVQISNYYKDLLSTSNDESVRKYIKGKIQKADYLINAIRQRQETILKITKAILQGQKEYLRRGKEKLKPMKMQEIAEQVDLHPSTISRACAGKFLASPQGLIELREFFSSGQNDETFSATAIREIIAKMIAQEDKLKPLSDSQIQKLLCKQKIKLARRTIAKYREQIGILPKHLRKSFKPQ